MRPASRGSKRLIDALEKPVIASPSRRIPPLFPAVAARSNTGDAEYEGMVERAREYIRAGDAFQIVLSQRYEAEFPLPAFALYRSLRRINPAPFLC